MQNNPRVQSRSSLPPANPAVAELKAIHQELEELRKEVSTLRDGLTDKVAKGVLIGSVAVVVLYSCFSFY